jgi:hypothetical protein
MSKRIEVPKTVTGRAFVGLWIDSHLGWSMPNIHPGGAISPTGNWWENARPGARAYRCQITITPLLDKRGRPITRVKRQRINQ